MTKEFQSSKIHKDRGHHVNKLELIDTMKNECQLTKKEAAAIVELFFDQISTALADGDRVEIRGLCSFFVKEYQSYQGRNPKTGEAVAVDSKKLPFFKIGKELKERVDY
jgi:integration host factor subunit beta